MLSLETPYLLVILGKQGSGKSHAVSYIFRENFLSKDRFDYGIVFSNTSWEDGAFSYLPKNYIYEEFDETIVENLMKLQRSNLKKKINTSAFILFDDCLDDEKQWTCKCIKKLSTQLRHYNITVIICSQYAHMIPPRVRSNSMANCIFDLGPGIRELDACYQAYGNKFESFKEFKNFYNENIKDHKFIMWNGDEDKYLVYRAPEDIPSFKFKYNKFK